MPKQIKNKQTHKKYSFLKHADKLFFFDQNVSFLFFQKN